MKPPQNGGFPLGRSELRTSRRSVTRRTQMHSETGSSFAPEGSRHLRQSTTSMTEIDAVSDANATGRGAAHRNACVRDRADGQPVAGDERQGDGEAGHSRPVETRRIRGHSCRLAKPCGLSVSQLSPSCRLAVPRLRSEVGHASALLPACRSLPRSRRSRPARPSRMRLISFRARRGPLSASA
jgi:hypothetical protein